MQEIIIDSPLPKEPSSGLVRYSKQYWLNIIEFSVNNEKYEELLFVFEQVKISKLSLLKNKKFYSECLKGLISLISNEGIEDDVNPRMDALFESLKKFPIDTSSTEYVRLFSKFNRYSQNWNGYERFLNWWQYDKVNLRFSNKLINSNVFKTKIKIEEFFFLVTAKSLILKNRDRRAFRKKDWKRYQLALSAVRKLNHSKRTSLRTFKIEGHLLVISNNNKLKIEYLLKCIHQKIDHDMVLDFLGRAFLKQPETQLNFICYLAFNSNSYEFELKCLRLMLLIFIAGL